MSTFGREKKLGSGVREKEKNVIIFNQRAKLELKKKKIG